MGKIKTNSIVLLIKEGILNISAIFVVGYMASKLGSEDYGKFAYSISFAVLFSILSNLGIRQYATREIVRNKDQAEDIYSKVVFTRLVLSLIMLLVGILTILLLGHDQVLFYLIVIALISKCFFTCTTNNFIVFEAYEDMKYNALSQTSSRVVVIVLTLVALLAGFGLLTVALIYLIGDFVQYVISYIIMKKKYFIPHFHISIKESISLVKKSVPFALFSVFYLIYFEISKILMLPLSSDKDVGLYQAASILAYKLLIVSDAIGTAIFPKIVELAKNNIKQYRILSYKALAFMGGLGMLSAIVIYYFADFIINLIYHSPEYAPSILLLKIIVWVIPLMFISKIMSYLLIANNHQNLLAGIYAFMVLVLIVLNLIWIPENGAEGAVWATLMAESLGVISFFIFYKNLGLSKA